MRRRVGYMYGDVTMIRPPYLALLARSCVSSSAWAPLILTSVTIIIYGALTCADAQARSTPDADDPVPVVTQDFHQRISPALRWTQEGVWQPPKSELSVGLTEVRWAPLRWLNINTWTLPWTVGGANIGAHVSLFSNERWAVSAEWRGLTIDFSRFASSSSDDPDAQEGEVNAPQLLVSPISISAGYLISPRLTVGLGLHYTAISAVGGVEQDAEFEGVAVSTNSHLRLHMGWAISRGWSAWWVVNYLLHQEVGGSAYSEIPFENGGSLKIYGAVSQNLVPRGAIGHRLYLGYRGEVFSISGGVAIKDAPLYLVGSVIPAISALPYFDLSWRW